MIRVGAEAPPFCLSDADGGQFCLEDKRGKKVVLYFYPKDNTPACTREAQDFSHHLEEFEERGVAVVGVSPDTAASHRRFTEKKELKVTLLSDPDRKVLELYGVWQVKKMFGKEGMGVVRSTVLLDEEGRVLRTWEKVKVPGHVEAVLSAIDEEGNQATGE